MLQKEQSQKREEDDNSNNTFYTDNDAFGSQRKSTMQYLSLDSPYKHSTSKRTRKLSKEPKAA